MKINYQKELEAILKRLPKDERKPVLVLHCCCAPCSTYVLQYLVQYFTIKILFYNPNISPPSEYDRRLLELHALLRQMKLEQEIAVLEAEYDPALFYERVRGLEDEPEGGKRCETCFALRLEEAGRQAKELGADFFTTTLTISPHKDSALLNELGQMVGERYGMEYLLSDFKKKDGFRQSIQLSREHDLYRQDYCGCIFSKQERERQVAEQAEKENG